MDVPQALHSRSVWADLDALVLEEVEALRAGRHHPAEAPPFASEEEFFARVSLYLRGHPNPESLVERLCAELAPLTPVEGAPEAANEPPPAPAPEQVDSAPTAESGEESAA